MNATVTTCECNGRGFIAGEFALTFCPCGARPDAASSLAAAIAAETRAYAASVALVPVHVSGDLLIACETCEGRGTLDCGGDGRREHTAACDCRNGQVIARCLYCAGELGYGIAIAIEDQRVSRANRRECCEWMCDDDACAAEHAARMGGVVA